MIEYDTTSRFEQYQYERSIIIDVEGGMRNDFIGAVGAGVLSAAFFSVDCNISGVVAFTASLCFVTSAVITRQLFGPSIYEEKIKRALWGGFSKEEIAVFDKRFGGGSDPAQVRTRYERYMKRLEGAAAPQAGCATNVEGESYPAVYDPPRQP